VNGGLQDWLQHLEQLQPDKIELGLSRIKQVALNLGLALPDFRIITVAGTNGKGSTVAYIDAMLSDLGFSTGVYTSPHFIYFSERIVVNGKRADDDALCRAFEAIESARGDIDLPGTVKLPVLVLLALIISTGWVMTVNLSVPRKPVWHVTVVR